MKRRTALLRKGKKIIDRLFKMNGLYATPVRRTPSRQGTASRLTDLQI